MASKQFPKEPDFATDYRKLTADLENEIIETKKVFEEIRMLNTQIMTKLNLETHKSNSFNGSTQTVKK